MTPEESTADPVGQLAEDFMARYRRGERPALSEYTAQHPELAERIRQLFPMMAAMEEADSGVSLAATCDASRADTDPVIKKREQIGGYRILREIGRGGMGIVYEAEQIALGRHVALKVLPLHAAKEGSSLERFQREAKAAARLHHTNIVPVHEVGQDDEVCYYAMQFIQGQPLDQVLDELRRLRQRPEVASPPVTHAPGSERTSAPPSPSIAQSLLTSTEPAVNPSARDSKVLSTEHSVLGTPYHRTVARLGVQVAQALHYAHQEGVIHRDIKPSNLLLDADGRMWITDFGLAKTDGAALTQTGDVVGTVRYMAPERFRGWSDPRSDVYSLGLTLYEMLLLQPAFRAPDRPRLIHQVLHTDPPHPRKVDRHIPRDLETIILKAIDKEPGRRYPTAAELAEDLQRFVDDKPILSRRVSKAEHVWRWCKRNRMVAGLIAAVILVTAVGFAAVFSQMQVAQANEQTANDEKGKAEKRSDELAVLNEKLRRANYVADMNLAENAMDVNNVVRVRELLNRHRPKPGETDLRGFEWHYFRRQFHCELLTVKAHVALAMTAAWTPDGKQIVSVGMSEAPATTVAEFKLPPGEVKRWDAIKGEQIPLKLKGPTDKVISGALSPDGKRFAAACRDKLVRVWDLDTGEPIELVGHTSQIVFWVAFSADGKRLASCAMLGDKPHGSSKSPIEIKVWDLDARKAITNLDEHPFTMPWPAFSPDGKRLAAQVDTDVIKVYDVPTGREFLILKDLKEPVWAMAFSPDNKQLAATCGKYVRIWDVPTGQSIRTLQGDVRSHRHHLAFSPNGKRLATSAQTGVLELWDTATGQLVRTFRPSSGGPSILAFNPDGTWLCSASFDGSLEVWDTGPDPNVVPIPASRSKLDGGLWLSPGGQIVLTGKEKNSNRLWNAVTGTPLGDVLDHEGETTNKDFSDDGKRLVLADTAKHVKIWDVASGKLVRAFKDQKKRINDVAISPDGKLLALAEQGGTLTIWDIDKGTEVRTIKVIKDDLYDLKFSPDGARLAGAAQTGSVKMWDVATGSLTLTAALSEFYVAYMRFSPDGKRLAVAGVHRFASGEVRILDTENGREVLRLEGHANYVKAVAFSPDGQRLASGGMDMAVKVWDLTSGQETLTLKGHTNHVTSLEFSSDGRRLMSAATDYTVRVWDATPLPE